MSLKIYNTLSRQKEEFVPLVPGQVKMYCCGPTVYGLLHVGNFRGAVFYNLVRNYLEHLGYAVTYVYNFTDVDDRIIAKAKAEGVDSLVISERYIAEFKKDLATLNLRAHDHNPKVTEFMPEIVKMIEELVKNEKAYVISTGEVLYSIDAFKDYGKLSGRNKEELMAGHRVEVDPRKKDPMDFALWKPVKPGEPSWPSPWGAGRPGWHIECSAMNQAILGDQIDIHGGGMDLIFPHHENEVAQTEGCTHKPFVKYWVHNNMINFGGQKMSKSLGNIKTAQDFFKSYHPEIYKYMILSVHYRSISDFSQNGIDTAIHQLARMYSALAVAESVVSGQPTPDQIDAGFKKLVDEAWVKITEGLQDDFNTPQVMAALFEVVRQFNSQVKRGMKAHAGLVSKSLQLLALFKKMGEMMALFLQPAEKFLTDLDDLLLANLNLKREAIDALVNERVQARLTKDFKKSDELRDQLLKMGIAVSDFPTGSTWEVQK